MTADGIVENAILLDSYTIPKENAKSPNSAMMHSMYSLADMGNGIELLKLYVEELRDTNTDGTIKRSYQLNNITKAPVASARVQGNILSPVTSTTSAYGYSVADLLNIVKSDFSDVLSKAACVRVTRMGLKNDGDNGIGKPISQQIDEWVAKGKNSRVFFNFGKLSNALREAGIGNNNIHLDASKVLKILADHKEMTLDVIKQLDNIINDPIIVLKSKAENVGESYVIYGNVVAENGKPVMVSIRTGLKSGVNAIEDVTKITSAYTRRNAQNLLDTSEAVWITPNKKRANDWSYSFGLQLPSATSKNNSLSENSIPQEKFAVKTDNDGRPIYKVDTRFKNDSYAEEPGAGRTGHSRLPRFCVALRY